MSEEDTKKHYSAATHQHVQHSTTLNRKYVHRPDIQRKAVIESVAKCQAENLRRRQELAEKINHERLMAMKQKRLQRGYVSPMMTTKAEEDDDDWAEMPSKKNSQELKDAAVKKALRSVATMEQKDEKRRAKLARKAGKRHSKRMILAFTCAIATVVSIVAFVAMNMPATMAYMVSSQSGIANAYPNYLPREAELATYSAAEGSVSMIFSMGDDSSFTITEEKSSWDSRALLTNYVEQKWNSYDTIKEQGLTIYVNGSNAAWVNGGVKYVITATRGTLTQKQIAKIATSF